MSKKQSTFVLIAGVVLGSNNIAVNAAGVEIYGKIHVSGDRIDTGSNTDVGISSNSTRLGFKGDGDLDQSWRALWKLESQLDATGENVAISPRNRYLGVQTAVGTFLAGVHDTPMKELGGKADFFADTIGDGRAIRGTASDGVNYFDQRASNVAVYISPNLNGFEIRGIASPGISALEDDPMLGGSLIYTGETIWGGAAYERRTTSATSRVVTGYRGAGGITFGSLKISAIGELFTDSIAASSTIDRIAAGGGISYTLGTFSVNGQMVMSKSSNLGNDNGMLWAAGVDQQLGKSTNIYVAVSGIQNSENSHFGIGSYHGDTYPGNANVSMLGMSAGIEHSF